MKRKDVIRLLIDNGYTQINRCGNGGGHAIYSNGIYRISIPNHAEINLYTVKKIVKVYNLGGM